MFVPVPDDASDLTLPKIGIVDLYFRTDDEEYENGYISVTIPPGNWKLLGDSKQLTEDDLVGVMPSVLMFHGREYLDFNPPPYNPAYRLSTALEALNSLKESLQLSEGKHIVLFEAKK